MLGRDVRDHADVGLARSRRGRRARRPRWCRARRRRARAPARAGTASAAGQGGCCGCDGWRVSARAERRARRACPSWTSCHSIRRCRSPSRPTHAAPDGAMAPSALERLVGLQYARRPRAAASDPLGTARRRLRRATTSSRKSCPSARWPSSAQNNAPGPAQRESMTTLAMRVDGSPLSSRVPVERPRRRARSPPTRAAPGQRCGRRTARRTPPMSWPCSWPLPRMRTRSPALRIRQRARDRAAAIVLDQSRRRRARCRSGSARLSARSVSERGLSLVT